VKSNHTPSSLQATPSADLNHKSPGHRSAVSRLQPQVARPSQRLQPTSTTSRPLPPQPTGILPPQYQTLLHKMWRPQYWRVIGVTAYRVWIGNCICWTPRCTTRDYTLQFSITHILMYTATSSLLFWQRLPKTDLCFRTVPASQPETSLDLLTHQPTLKTTTTTTTTITITAAAAAAATTTTTTTPPPTFPPHLHWQTTSTTCEISVTSALSCRLLAVAQKRPLFTGWRSAAVPSLIMLSRIYSSFCNNGSLQAT
jgi:hypothetical protein